MSKRLQRRWAKACERWVHRLWVSDWARDYVVADDLPDKYATREYQGTMAGSEIMASYKEATLILHGKNSAGASDKKLDELARHEVLHMVLAPYDHTVQDIIEELPKQKRRPFEKWLESEKEAVVVHLEHALGLWPSARSGS